jgi:hypothetical protein
MDVTGARFAVPRGTKPKNNITPRAATLYGGFDGRITQRILGLSGAGVFLAASNIRRLLAAKNTTFQIFRYFFIGSTIRSLSPP